MTRGLPPVRCADLFKGNRDGTTIGFRRFGGRPATGAQYVFGVADGGLFA